MLATSPGPGGARNVLTTAKNSAPYFAGEVKADLSIASFYDCFDLASNKITDANLDAQLKQALNSLLPVTA